MFRQAQHKSKPSRQLRESRISRKSRSLHFDRLSTGVSIRRHKKRGGYSTNACFTGLSSYQTGAHKSVKVFLLLKR